MGSLIVQSKSVKIDIGPEAAFTKLPALVDVSGTSYFLIKTRDGYKLLSRLCPHQGGTVEDEGGQFVVPITGISTTTTGGSASTRLGSG